MPSDFVKRNSTSALDNLIYIAELYYIQGKSQQEIANITHQSRTNISRLLKICVDDGIVEFRIKKSPQKRLQLAAELEKKYSLSKVLIVPSGGTDVQLTRRISIETGEYLKKYLNDNMLIGLAWGTMIYEIINNFSTSHRYEIDTIQCVGGVCPNSPSTDGQFLTKTLAANFNGTAHLLNAPMIVANSKTKEFLLSEPVVKDHFNRMKQTDIILLGIGNNKENSSLFLSGNLTPEEIYNVQHCGAVADICGTGIDIDGNVCETILKNRTIAINMDTLKNIPMRIGSAYGEQKIQAIVGTLRGHYLTVLVTDEATAEMVLDY